MRWSPHRWFRRRTAALAVWTSHLSWLRAAGRTPPPRPARRPPHLASKGSSVASAPGTRRSGPPRRSFAAANLRWPLSRGRPAPGSRSCCPRFARPLAATRVLGFPRRRHGYRVIGFHVWSSSSELGGWIAWFGDSDRWSHPSVRPIYGAV